MKHWRSRRQVVGRLQLDVDQAARALALLLEERRADQRSGYSTPARSGFGRRDALPGAIVS